MRSFGSGSMFFTAERISFRVNTKHFFSYKYPALQNS